MDAMVITALAPVEAPVVPSCLLSTGLLSRRKVDVDIQETCERHSRGEAVAITRGGNRVRLQTSLPNGGQALVTYDTRYTSDVCGRVIYLHHDNTEVRGEE